MGNGVDGLEGSVLSAMEYSIWGVGFGLDLHWGMR